MTQLIIGIGCETAQDLPAEVLKHSILSHASRPPLVIKLNETPQWIEMTKSLKSAQRTPFSFQRFLVARQLLDSPADIGVYLDSDMLVFRPMEDLVAAFRTTGSHIATVEPLQYWRRRPQSSVMVMDREGAQLLWQSYTRLLEDSIDYDQLMYLRTIGPVGLIEYRWNCLEYLDESSALIHYTDMDTQPWLRDGNPNAGVWYTYLWRLAQTSEGRRLIEVEIALGHVRPALQEIVDLGPSISAFSVRARLKDAMFVPPHRFKRISGRGVRMGLAPLLKIAIAMQFLLTNGQPNIR